MNYRVKQFYWSVTSSLKEVDKNLTKKYLNQKEIEVFNRLKNSEQHHSIRVCNDAIDMAKKENININKVKLAKIALLHDVGKIVKPLNVIDKSLLVLLDKFTKGNLRKYTNIKKIDAYYNHPIKSVKILSRIKDYDNEFLEAIKEHHEDENKKNNIYLKIIKVCDDKN